jgi:hypothetical protein
MRDPLTLIGTLVWIAVIGALVAHRVWAVRAQRRRTAHLCVRCGKELSPADMSDASRRSTCAKCCASAQGGYRAASYFFYGITGVLVAMAPFVVVGDFRRFGFSTAVIDSALLLGVTGLTAAAGLGIRYFGAKET